MTLPPTASEIRYQCDGGTTAFPVPFPFLGIADLVVIEFDPSVPPPDPLPELVLGSDYTVSGGNGLLGTVHAVVAPAAGRHLIIRRETERNQLLSYLANTGLPAEAHEDALDRTTMYFQELAAAVSRVFSEPKTDDPAENFELPKAADRQDKFLAFDAEGRPIVSPGKLATESDPENPPDVSAFMATLLDDADAGVARVTLVFADGMPSIAPGDAGELIVVNPGETGFEAGPGSNGFLADLFFITQGY